MALRWGLGPGGHMERFELNGKPIARVDWAADPSAGCVKTAAADAGQSRRCPNSFVPIAS